MFLEDIGLVSHSPEAHRVMNLQGLDIELLG